MSSSDSEDNSNNFADDSDGPRYLRYHLIHHIECEISAHYEYEEHEPESGYSHVTYERSSDQNENEEYNEDSFLMGSERS